MRKSVNCATALTVICNVCVTQVWNVADLSLVGVCSGHTGGVWCVQFSPVDQCLATASADSTVKMWALSNFSCVRVRCGVCRNSVIMPSYHNEEHYALV